MDVKSRAEKLGIKTGIDGLAKFIELAKQDSSIKKVLDVGSGLGYHAQIMRENGLEVTTIDLGDKSDVKADYLKYKFDTPFDAVHCSHVLEHQLNVNNFLTKVRRDLRYNGIAVITVPPLKHKIVGGHLSLWNEGLLLYNLILAGFDCKKAMVKKYGYNITAIVKKKTIQLPDNLHMDCGDIEKLQEFFPFKAEQGFDGRLENINWD